MSVTFVFMCFVIAFQQVMIVALYVKMSSLERDYKAFQKKRNKFYEAMSDPESPGNDFREVNLTEARQTAPRADAGPPAKVYRPPLRSVPATSWRPRNESSPKYPHNEGSPKH